MIVFGALGLLLISYALWVKNEKKQDILYIVGGILLLVYSIFIKDIIFIILQIVFVFSALLELMKLNKRASEK